MSFFRKHQEYIQACVKVRAIEVADFTHCYSDVDDYFQEMIVYCLRYADKYNPNRSTPHTFINRLSLSAKAQLLRHLNRRKNTIISQAVGIDDEF